MLCLPVFIILLLLASPAAPNPLQTRIQSNLIRAGPEDANIKTDKRVIISGLLASILVPLIDAIKG
uniref:Conotoxin VnMLCL-041 n=1 Tax=Conus ventricosus TaxID=117992 RepID=CT0C6_CONVE|nr:RecName: Full=Conotoxin VnMLCL-041; Flags: Precursor [Conus ventricosus]AAG60426.1 conotoxin precursor [Conus ventricosus]